MPEFGLPPTKAFYAAEMPHAMVNLRTRGMLCKDAGSAEHPDSGT